MNEWMEWAKVDPTKVDRAEPKERQVPPEIAPGPGVIEVGQTWRTRDGSLVKIEARRRSDEEPMVVVTTGDEERRYAGPSQTFPWVVKVLATSDANNMKYGDVYTVMHTGTIYAGKSDTWRRPHDLVGLCSVAVEG